LLAVTAQYCFILLSPAFLAFTTFPSLTALCWFYCSQYSCYSCYYSCSSMLKNDCAAGVDHASSLSIVHNTQSIRIPYYHFINYLLTLHQHNLQYCATTVRNTQTHTHAHTHTHTYIHTHTHTHTHERTYLQVAGPPTPTTHYTNTTLSLNQSWTDTVLAMYNLVL
jgi:hypothetical protein